MYQAYISLSLTLDSHFILLPCTRITSAKMSARSYNFYFRVQQLVNFISKFSKFVLLVIEDRQQGIFLDVICADGHPKTVFWSDNFKKSLLLRCKPAMSSRLCLVRRKSILVIWGIYIAIQVFLSTRATIALISNSVLGSKFWLVPWKTPALGQSYTLRGYMLLVIRIDPFCAINRHYCVLQLDCHTVCPHCKHSDTFEFLCVV